MKSPVASNYWFCLLFNVVCLLWVMPHSDAGIEHMYALANKNKADGTDRNRLDIEGFLSSILAVKFAWPEVFLKCYNFKPDEKVLHDVKKATRKYNTLHSSIFQISQHCNKHYFLNFILTQD